VSSATITHESTWRKYTRPVDRAVARDARLSWGARGLFIFLADLPEGWRIQISHLTSMAPDGRDAVRARLGELERVGAVRIEPVRLVDGTCCGYRWIIFAPENWAKESPLKYDKTDNGKTDVGFSVAKVLL